MTDEAHQKLWNFPCEFPIKVMGKATEEFEVFVLATIRKHAPDLGEGAIEMRPSENGNYLSITATIRATSKAQLDALYVDLTASKLVLMVL